MQPVSCAGCRALQRRLDDLQAENERLRRELTDVRNRATLCVAQANGVLDLGAGRLGVDDRVPIQVLVERVRLAATGEDVLAIRRSIHELEQATDALSLYLRGQPGPYRRQTAENAMNDVNLEI